jgi:hypothetical protein
LDIDVTAHPPIDVTQLSTPSRSSAARATKVEVIAAMMIVMAQTW